MPGYAQSPPSPPIQHDALMPRIGGVQDATNTIATINSNTISRLPEDLRLTREAMKRYLRDPTVIKVIVIRHAKVN